MRRQKKRPFVSNKEVEKKQKKAPHDVPQPTDVSSIVKYYGMLPAPPCSSESPIRSPNFPQKRCASRALKRDKMPPLVAGKAYTKRRTRPVTKSLDAVKRRVDGFGCVACANGTAEILICSVCKKVKCVQYTTKITATLHLL